MREGRSKLTFIEDPVMHPQLDPMDMASKYCLNSEVCPRCAAAGRPTEIKDLCIYHKTFLGFLQTDRVSFTGSCSDCGTVWHEEARIPNTLRFRKPTLPKFKLPKIKLPHISEVGSYDAQTLATKLSDHPKLKLFFWIIVAIIGCGLCVKGLIIVGDIDSPSGFWLIMGAITSIAIGICGWVDYIAS
jgi:hypothetical protein